MRPGLVRSLFVLVFASGAEALDVVRMKDGRLVRGRISYVAGDEVKMQMVIEGPRGSGSAVRDVPTEKVEWIDFQLTELEERVFKDPDSVTKSELHQLWGARSVRLEDARSRSGELGLIYARRLLGSTVAAEIEDSMRVFGIVEARDWNPLRRGEARAGRLRALMALGRADEAVSEAEALAKTTEDPSLLIEARYILALASFERLRALEDEHPRWEEDDEVRPERDFLFHLTVDRHLFAYLQHGSEEEAAARGLWGAREVFEFAGEDDRARGCARDIVELYGHSAYGDRARAYLERNNHEEETN